MYVAEKTIMSDFEAATERLGLCLILCVKKLSDMFLFSRLSLRSCFGDYGLRPALPVLWQCLRMVCVTVCYRDGCKRRPFAFRKVSFQRVKGKLLQCERIPFALCGGMPLPWGYVRRWETVPERRKPYGVELSQLPAVAGADGQNISGKAFVRQLSVTPTRSV